MGQQPNTTIRGTRAVITAHCNTSQKMGRNAAMRLCASVCVALAASLSVFSGASAEDRVYTVAKFPVEASGKSAVIAKKEALAEGQRLAFRSLVKRLVPVTHYKRLPKFSDVRVSDLVDGFAVRDEQNSRTEYLATLDFKFQPKNVRAVLRRYGLPFVEEQAPELSIVPLFGIENLVPEALSAYGKSRGKPAPRFERVWTRAWSGLDLKNALTPLAIKPRISALTPEILGSLLAGDQSADQMLRGEYEGPVVFALADVSVDKKRLLIRMVGTDNIGTIDITRGFTFDPEDAAYTAESAAVVMFAMLEGRWKEVNKPATINVGTQTVTASGTPVSFIVQFNGLREWQAIRVKLASTPGVDEFETGVVSTRGAEVSLQFPGGVERLARRLAQDGLFLQNQAGNWVMRRN